MRRIRGISMIVGALAAIAVGIFPGEEVSTLWPPSFLAATVGFVAGRHEGTTAFQESVDRAPAAQEALREIELPGRRLIRGRILDYRKTEMGYSLQVDRWSLRFVGDEQTALAPVPFTEEKAP